MIISCCINADNRRRLLSDGCKFIIKDTTQSHLAWHFLCTEQKSAVLAPECLDVRPLMGISENVSQLWLISYTNWEDTDCLALLFLSLICLVTDCLRVVYSKFWCVVFTLSKILFIWEPTIVMHCRFYCSLWGHNSIMKSRGWQVIWEQISCANPIMDKHLSVHLLGNEGIGRQIGSWTNFWSNVLSTQAACSTWLKSMSRPPPNCIIIPTIIH